MFGIAQLYAMVSDLSKGPEQQQDDGSRSISVMLKFNLMIKKHFMALWFASNFKLQRFLVY